MKCKILHESAGRMRVHLNCRRMTLHQADVLEYYLRNVDGVREVSVFDRTQDAVIIYRAGRAALVHALAAFSFDKAETMDLVPDHTTRKLNREFEDKLSWTVIRRVISKLFFPLPVTTALAIYHSIKYIREGIEALLHGKLSVAVLDATAVTVSMVRGDFSTASSVMFMLRLGEILEDWTHKKSVADLAGAMSLNVDHVWLKTGETETLVPIGDIQAGDCVVVRTGSLIPLDGKVVSGEAMVNQASMTGESMPVPKREGSYVYAGTVAEEGECVVRVEKALGGGRYDRIVRMIEESEKLKSTAEDKASRLADKLVPYTLGGTILTYLITRNVTKMLAVLMVDFSCALKLSMPIAVLSAMRESSSHHISVKGGRFLEAVAQANTIVFDKTGTLTYATPKVAQIITFGGNEESEMLRLAACLEEHYPHSIANAVVAEARDRGLTHEEYHSQVQYVVAHGISSVVDDKKVLIGSAHFVFEDEGCRVPEGEEDKFEFLPSEYSHLYLCIAGELAAVICIHDPLRKEAKAAVRAMIEDKTFGQSGARVVIEEYMEGPEVSVLSFTDGEALVPMVSSMDHKRALDGDKGPNTGGMGAVAPNPYYTKELAAECIENIFLPTIRAMRAEGRPFRGCLYFGLMLTKSGPKVVEYNCRFGDPETQAVLPLLKSDLLTVMQATTNGTLADASVEFSTGSACCVVLASEGYPKKYESGFPITMSEEAAAHCYVAGAKKDGDTLLTAGGRVLGITAAAPTLRAAVEEAYRLAEGVAFANKYCRGDIGSAALAAREERG